MKSHLRIALTALCLLAVPSFASAVEIEQLVVFELDPVVASTIDAGFVVEPGVNVLSFGGEGVFPIETTNVSGQMSVRVRFDDTTAEVRSIRFAEDQPHILTGDRPINFFVNGLGYVHVGANVSQISNPDPATPAYQATGNPIGKILPRTSVFTPVDDNGVFDADRHSLMITSGQYIASGLVASAFVIPADQVYNASENRLIITSSGLDPAGDMGQITLRQTANGLRGTIRMNLSDQFGHLVISGTTVPEPSGAVLAAGVMFLGLTRRRGKRHLSAPAIS